LDLFISAASACRCFRCVVTQFWFIAKIRFLGDLLNPQEPQHELIYRKRVMHPVGFSALLHDGHHVESADHTTAPFTQGQEDVFCPLSPGLKCLIYPDDGIEYDSCNEYCHSEVLQEDTVAPIQRIDQIIKVNLIPLPSWSSIRIVG
jgi:hypothetical protein